MVMTVRWGGICGIGVFPHGSDRQARVWVWYLFVELSGGKFFSLNLIYRIWWGGGISQFFGDIPTPVGWAETNFFGVWGRASNTRAHPSGGVGGWALFLFFRFPGWSCFSLYIFLHFYICLCVFAYFLCVFVYIFRFLHIKLID